MAPKPNKTRQSTANDIVMTRREVAEFIVNHFHPTGSILEPCRGEGAFLDVFPDNLEKYWCEISQGKDFFDFTNKVDWIITNPPFSIYDDFLLHSFEVSNNVVFLCPLQKAFKSIKIEKAITEYGGLKEVLMLGSGGKIGFPFGFPVGCLHYQRGYKGDVKITKHFT